MNKTVPADLDELMELNENILFHQLYLYIKGIAIFISSIISLKSIPLS